MPANLENSAVVTGLEQVSFHSIPKDGQCQRMLKLSHSYTHLICLQSNAPFCKPVIIRMWTMNFQMFKLDLEKTEEPEIKLPTSIGSSKKWASSRKTSAALLTMPKPLTVWITTNCGKFLKTWEYQTTFSASWEIYMQVKKQVRIGHGTIDWFQIGKDYVKVVYHHPAYLTYTQSTSCEMLVWMKHNLELIAGRNINNLRYADDTTLMAERGTNEPLFKKVYLLLIEG